jgi:hypothetical protein
MTTIARVSRNCAICRTVSSQIVLGSTNAFGPSDLDTRPAEMLRSTLPYWIERCPACGFCAPDISKPQEGAAGIVRTPAYQEQLRDPGFPALANSFLCHALLLEHAARYSDGGWAAVHAAWACDDEGSPAASRCRERAVLLFRMAREQGQAVAAQPGADEAVLTDLLRRSGHDGEAMAACRDGLAMDPEPLIAAVLRFQQALIGRGDRKPHTISDAMEAPGKAGFEFPQ